jgi:protein gp37
MERWAKQAGKEPWEVHRAADATFFAPRKWKEKNRRVFTCSLGDFFHPSADKWREEVWDIIRDTPHLNYLILTKRPELVGGRMPVDWKFEYERAFKHVWLGVTVENQDHVNRIAQLAAIPMEKLFVSAEPLLSEIDFAPWLSMVDWMIIGGESGMNARIMQPEWVENIVDQSRDYKVPVFFKQWGARKRSRQEGWGGNVWKGGTLEEWPE